MTLSKQTIVLGIDDAKIFQLTADDSAQLVYGAAIDVPGIQGIQLSPSFTEKGLKGDEKIMDYYIKLDLINWSFHSAKISLDALTILEGGCIDSSDPTKHVYTVKDSSVPQYFKLEAKANYTAGEVGDFHLRLYKCKANSVQVEYSTQEYAIVTAAGIAIPTVNNGNVKDYTINATPVSI